MMFATRVTAVAIALSSSVLAASATDALSFDALRNDGIHLAILPKCGSLNSWCNVTSNVNSGLRDFREYKTIVTFGDSYTTGGVTDGSPLAPPVVIPPNPKAGGRTTNGRVWIENMALDTGARLLDYAVGGAVVNRTLWPSKANASDFVGQVKIFLSQNHTFNPDNTLYTVFFGINDWSASKVDGNKLPLAATQLLAQIKLLASPPTNARSFLVTDDYGRGTHEATGDAFKLQVFHGLDEFQRTTKTKPYGGVKVGFVDFAPLWDGVLGTIPGYKAFGYLSTAYCVVNSSSTVGECADPDHTFYWISGHPSKQTHRIMGDYVETALKLC